MNDAHLHLVVNHLPIVIPILGLFILLGGFIFRSEIVKRTAYFVFLSGAVCAILAMTTGEGAEELVEKIQGIDEKFINTHEESAEVFAILSYVLGGVSLLGLWSSWKEKSFSKAISFAILLISLVVLFYARQTGTSGGEIRHSEIRSGANGSDANTTEGHTEDE